jgi:putative molybdopterin biosynthesis protein
MARNVYLSNLPLDEALTKYFSALNNVLVPRFEQLDVTQSLGRVTKSPVYARLCSPLFNAAAMDGIAVRAAGTVGARENNPLTLTRGKDFVVVDTGDPVKPPYDAVIMAEDTMQVDADTVKIIAASSPWQHIRPIGEDIVTGEMLVASRQTIRPIDIGVLLSGGITRIEVYQKPRVAIFPTGSEIIEPEQTPKEGEIIESNTRMFEAQVIAGGGMASRFAVIPDEYARIKDAVAKAVHEYDMVLINAGSSAGTEDFTVHVLRELGNVIVHGVAIKPGKPVILAVVNGKPVIGIPGYPVSAFLVYELFVAPLLCALSGRREKTMERIQAIIAKRLVSGLKHREYVRVKVGKVDGKLVASPLARGAGAAMSLVRADGFCIIEQNSEGVEAGESVSVDLYRSLDDIEHTLVSIGSHDLILDVISDLMYSTHGAYLTGTHVGSMAGLMALKRGQSHIAPTHLLDEATGAYNIPVLCELFPCTDAATAREICLIKGVGRVQGLIVQKNNPLAIQDERDLVRCSYINRQRGAGTRLFLDYRLKKAGIAGERINGYEREAATHMAVAAAVLSGSADAGMGISSAASALGLDFIPLGDEEYDFAVPKRFLSLPHMQAFITILQSPVFHQKLAELGGYTWAHAGEIVSV